MFLIAFFNEELSTGLMGPAASETLSKCCISSEVVAETLSYRAEFCLGSGRLLHCGLKQQPAPKTSETGDGLLIEPNY